MQFSRLCWYLSSLLLLGMNINLNAESQMQSAAATPQSSQSLRIASWGGAYENSQRIAYFEPFSQATGIAIEIVQHNGTLAQLRQLAKGSEPQLDLIDLSKGVAIAGCKEGLLARFDISILAPAEGATHALEDFYPDSAFECGITQLISAIVIAFDDRAFPGDKPSSVSDFFDTNKFPGKRGLRRDPEAALEWALLSYGVPYGQIYDLLSTKRGLDLAFARLSSIREDIIWWERGSEPPELLATKKVVMSSGYNGRFFDRQMKGLPVSIIWQGEIIEYAVWSIIKGTKARAIAEDFIRFATLPKQMALQASHISYGPTRYSAWRKIGLHAVTKQPMRNHMPNAVEHISQAIVKDPQWYASTEELRQRRFEKWLAKTQN